MSDLQIDSQQLLDYLDASPDMFPTILQWFGHHGCVLVGSRYHSPLEVTVNTDWDFLAVDTPDLRGLLYTIGIPIPTMPEYSSLTYKINTRTVVIHVILKSREAYYKGREVNRVVARLKEEFPELAKTRGKELFRVIKGE